MVNARNQLGADLLVIHIEAREKIFRTDLHAVAKTDGLDLRISLHISRDDRHRVGVIEEPGVGADLLHIAGEVTQHVNGAQTAENSADAEGVGNGLAQTVLFRYLEIYDGAGVVKSHLNGVYNEIGIAQSVLAVLDAEEFANESASVVIFFVQRIHHHVGLLESVAVNIVERDLAFAERGSQKNVTEHVFTEYGAACTHKGDFHKRTSNTLFF